MTSGPATSPSRLVAGEDWRSVASCRSSDPDLFFPVSASGRSVEQATLAKAICAACRVRRECLEFALRTRQVHGIWVGLTEEERHLAAEAYAGTTQTTAGGAA
jgi:WhiB family redox-sensing transcriptional regulator